MPSHIATILAMGNLTSTYNDIEKYTEAEKLQIQVQHVNSKIFGKEHPATILAMINLPAIQTAMSQSMKVDNADTQVLNTSHGVSVTRDCHR